MRGNSNGSPLVALLPTQGALVLAMSAVIAVTSIAATERGNISSQTYGLTILGPELPSAAASPPSASGAPP